MSGMHDTGGNKIAAMKDQLQAKKMMRKGFLFYAS